MAWFDIDRWPLSYRLFALVSIVGTAMMALCGLASWQNYGNLYEAKLADLRHLTETAVTLAADYHRRMEDGEFTEEEAKAGALAAIGALRYDGSNYFWVNDMTPAMVMHPIKPALNGKDLSAFADPEGKRLFVEFADVVRAQGAGYVDYAWPRPGSEEPVEKESYVAGFAPWGWVIGTGVYIDDVVEKAWAAAFRLMATTIAIIVAAGLLALWLSYSITRPLLKLTDVADKLAKGENVKVPKMPHSSEIGQLARSFQVFAARGLEATRLRSALDACSNMVMVTNRRFDIVYLNPSMEAFLRQFEAAARHSLPEFQAHHLVGKSIDIFHRQPENVRRLVATLRETHVASIEFAGRQVELALSPIRSPSDEFQGTVVEWADVTAEISLQSEISDLLNAANQGDFSQRLDPERSVGIYRRLTLGINQLVHQVHDATSEIGDMLAALAGGNLNHRINRDYQGQFGELKQSANATAERLASLVEQIRAASNEVHQAAAEIGNGTDDLSRRTEQAASSLEETAASAEQMAGTVKQNAEHAKSASELAISADKSAKTGGEVVERTVEAMAAIEGSAQKITDIISVIDEIAFQTNLLALNASVEAARAGEAGKGFAVVAQEVRQLAQRSANAATDIKVLIQDSNAQVKCGVDLVNQAGDSLADIVGSIGRVAGIVQEISTASQEQASGVQEINASINSMEAMTQQNSSLVDKNSVASHVLADQAGKLAELMDFFVVAGDDASVRSQPGMTKKSNSVVSNKKLSVTTSAEGGWAEF